MHSKNNGWRKSFWNDMQWLQSWLSIKRTSNLIGRWNVNPNRRAEVWDGSQRPLECKNEGKAGRPVRRFWFSTDKYVKPRPLQGKCATMVTVRLTHARDHDRSHAQWNVNHNARTAHRFTKRQMRRQSWNKRFLKSHISVKAWRPITRWQ